MKVKIKTFNGDDLIVSRRLVQGVGVNDWGHPVSVNNKQMLEYQLWTDIMRRCYSEFELKRHPSYIGCEASDKFKIFSNFVYWCRDQVGFGVEGWQLDKDILIRGNKLYSEDTCCFVPPEINSLFLKNKLRRGNHLIGVSKYGNKFKSMYQQGGKCKFLGYYETENEAFNAYKKDKEEYVKYIANKWRGKIDDRVYQSLMEYEVNIGD